MEPAPNAVPELPARATARHRWLLPASLAVVFVAVCVSRVVVFPASIWEQDEAYFAAAVVEIDLDASAPHPPFFPLWIGIGKVVALLGFAPAMSLQLASAVLGSLVFFPLFVLWSRFMAPALALSATVLGLAMPGVWLLSGRAFSGTAATAMLVAALACWTRPVPDRRWLAAGSVAAGLSILIRPHFILVIAAVMFTLLTKTNRENRLTVIAPAAAVVLVGTIIFIVAAGGPAAVAAASSRHGALHFGDLPSASRNPIDSGLFASLGHPVVAIGWCVLTILGIWVVLRSPRTRSTGIPVIAALIPVIALVLGLSNPTHPRYAVPLVLLSCGFVVVGLGRILTERWALGAVATTICGAGALVLPSAAIYRQQASPPLRALVHADRLAVSHEAMVVIDRRLHSFVLMREASGATSASTLFDHIVELGASPSTLDWRTVMVFEGDHHPLLVTSESTQTFTCSDNLLRRLSQDRFLDVTVADNATLEANLGPGGPLVVLD